MPPSREPRRVASGLSRLRGLARESIEPSVRLLGPFLGQALQARAARANPLPADWSVPGRGTWWRRKYRIDRREEASLPGGTDTYVQQYQPDVSIKGTRRRRDVVRGQLADGIEG